VDTVTIDQLKELAKIKDSPAVSLFLPTHPAPEARQDAIRLRILAERTQAALEDFGLRRAEARDLLAAVHELPNDAEFWKRLSQGLAIFVTPRLFRAYRLPAPIDESITVNRRLNIKPLLRFADAGERFLLLILSQKRVQLYEVTRPEIREMAVRNLPPDKRTALNYVGADRGEQVHSAMHGSLGKQAAVFHGQGGEKDAAKSDLGQYFQMVARALEPVLKQETAPLLLAGVEYLLPIFRQHCSYAPLTEKHLAGNCDFLTNQQLYERSWEIMHPYFERPRREALRKLQGLLGTGKASADTVEVVEAAASGKIDVLFADGGREQQGTYDEKLGRAVTSNGASAARAASAGDEDLVNLAIAEVLTHGGTAFASEPGELPAAGPLAAIFRY
jgi:hypothetical protein